MKADGGGDEADLLYLRLLSEATASGYFLNPDEAFARDLVKGLVTNRKRYGYQSCPCRLASGEAAADRDIVCPCDYRDADLTEYGACYCALYVSREVAEGRQTLGPVPERRPPPGTAAARKAGPSITRSTPALSRLAVPRMRLPVRAGRAARDMSHMQGRKGPLREVHVARLPDASGLAAFFFW